MRILLQARKFFCVDERCSRRIFTERLPGTVARYGRRSCRSNEALSWVTMELGGRAGARLARKLGLLTSGSTLLRELRKRARPSASSAPRVIGIEEWAWKKGHRYGTILCDLEQRRVIDLLEPKHGDSSGIAASTSECPSSQPGPGEFLCGCDRKGQYPAAEAFHQEVAGLFEAREREREAQRLRRSLSPQKGPRFLSLERFRSSTKYKGRPAAADIAFCVAAYANGMSEDRIERALEDDYLSRDPSPSKRASYIRRTMIKAKAWASP